MPSRIERDRSRFKNIVEGQVRKDLGKYINTPELVGKKGKDIVRISIPQIKIPHFEYGENMGGVGSGEGEEGQPIFVGEPDHEPGGAGGNLPGTHPLEAEVSIAELVKFLRDQIELPNLLPRGIGTIEGERIKVEGIQVAMSPKFDFKRAFKEALEETQDPQEAAVLAHSKPHARYRSYEIERAPQARAVIFYVMDISGSMTDYYKKLARQTAFWTERLIESTYPKVEKRFIVHEVEAKEVDEKKFYLLREGGGTNISSAYNLVDKIIDKEYNPEDWNIYVIHFSDGENEENDNEKALNTFEKLLPKTRIFGFVRIKQQGMFGGAETNFVNRLQSKAIEAKLSGITGEHERRFALAKVGSNYDTYEAILELFGKRK